MMGPFSGVGIDQFGERYYFHRWPRKEIMSQLDCKHASKMYIDSPKGKSFHIGYVIKGHWIAIFREEKIKC